VTSADGS